MFKEIFSVDFDLLELAHIIRNLFDRLTDKGGADGTDFTILDMRTEKTALFGCGIPVAVKAGVIRRDLLKDLGIVPDEIREAAEVIVLKFRSLFLPP